MTNDMPGEEISRAGSNCTTSNMLGGGKVSKGSEVLPTARHLELATLVTFSTWPILPTLLMPSAVSWAPAENLEG